MQKSKILPLYSKLVNKYTMDPYMILLAGGLVYVARLLYLQQLGGLRAPGFANMLNEPLRSKSLLSERELASNNTVRTGDYAMPDTGANLLNKGIAPWDANRLQFELVDRVTQDFNPFDPSLAPRDGIYTPSLSTKGQNPFYEPRNLNV